MDVSYKVRKACIIWLQISIYLYSSITKQINVVPIKLYHNMKLLVGKNLHHINSAPFIFTTKVMLA